MAREASLLEQLRSRLPAIGDDAAVVETAAGTLVLCADACVAGVHADLSLVGVDDLGWKAMASCVSDVAAMGGQPRWALVTVSGDVDLEVLYDGLLGAAEKFGCEVVGGDLTGGGHPLVVSVSVVGSVDGQPVRRSGASAGDTVFVTGSLGASAAGLALLRAGRPGVGPDLVAAHRRPAARVDEGTAARVGGATAMIDVSDGLAIDLHRLCDESGVGVVLDKVPLFYGVRDEALALGGGEDYELLFCAPDAVAVSRAFSRAKLRAPLVIGRCVADPSVRLLRDEPLPRVGWEHAW